MFAGERRMKWWYCLFTWVNVVICVITPPKFPKWWTSYSRRTIDTVSSFLLGHYFSLGLKHTFVSGMWWLVIPHICFPHKRPHLYMVKVFCGCLVTIFRLRPEIIKSWPVNRRRNWSALCTPTPSWELLVSSCCLCNIKWTFSCVQLPEHTWRARRCSSQRIMLLVSEQSVRAKSWLARRTLLSWRQRRGSRSASPAENKTSAENCASTCTASLLLMDMNIYLVGRYFHGGGELVACCEQRHELMKWSLPDICVSVWIHKCISQHP